MFGDHRQSYCYKEKIFFLIFIYFCKSFRKLTSLVVLNCSVSQWLTGLCHRLSPACLEADGVDATDALFHYKSFFNFFFRNKLILL